MLEGPRSESVVSIENVNLNTSFNLGSFTSVGGTGGQVLLTSNQNRNNCPESVPETVKEASRESEDSINDRGSKVYRHNSPFQLKNSKQNLMHRIMPHHCPLPKEPENSRQRFSIIP